MGICSSFAKFVFHLLNDILLDEIVLRMYSLLAFLLRAFGGGLSRKGGLCGSFTTSWISIASCIACLTFFILHIYRMAFVHFDYGYNMKVCFKIKTKH